MAEAGTGAEVVVGMIREGLLRHMMVIGVMGSFLHIRDLHGGQDSGQAHWVALQLDINWDGGTKAVARSWEECHLQAILATVILAREVQRFRLRVPARALVQQDGGKDLDV